MAAPPTGTGRGHTPQQAHRARGCSGDEQPGIQAGKRPWTAGSNHARLSSVGVGFAWLGPSQWQAQVQVAKPFGAEAPVAARQTNARLWVWLLKGF